jgi:hypothetical protein
MDEMMRKIRTTDKGRNHRGGHMEGSPSASNPSFPLLYRQIAPYTVSLFY